MPCRSEAPLVAMRKPAAARCPTTVGPFQPGLGCTATPTGLSMTTSASSSWMILMPSTISGTTATGSTSAGIGTCSRAPAATRSDLATACAVQRDDAPGDQLGGAGPREAEHPGHRGVDALAGQSVGDADRRGVLSHDPPVCSCCSAALRGPHAGDADTADRLEDDHAGGDVDADVGDVEDRPVGQLEEVDDVAAQEAGLAEDAVGEVAEDAAEQAAEAERPEPARPGGGQYQSTTTTAPTAMTDSTTVYDVPVLNAAPGLRTRLSWRRSPTTCTGGSPVELLDGQHLGAEVEQVRRRTRPRRRGCRGRRDRCGSAVAGVAPAVSDAPRAACMSGTVSHAGTPSTASCRWADRSSRRRRRCRPSMRSSACSVWREHVAGVVGQGHLVVALERGRADVGLVVAGTVTGVAHQVGELVLGEVELGAEPVAVGGQLGADLVELLGGPRLLVGLDRQPLGAARRAWWPQPGRRASSRAPWRRAFAGPPSWRAPSWPATLAGAAFVVVVFLVGAVLAAVFFAGAAFLAAGGLLRGSSLLGGAPSSRGPSSRAPSWPGSLLRGRLLRRRSLLRGAPSSPGAFFAARLLRRRRLLRGSSLLRRRSLLRAARLLRGAPSSRAQPSWRPPSCRRSLLGGGVRARSPSPASQRRQPAAVARAIESRVPSRVGRSRHARERIACVP